MQMQCNTDRQNVESKTTTVTKWHSRSAVCQIHCTTIYYRNTI